MNQPTITLELGLSQASIMATALQNLVGSLNAVIPEFIALEGEGTGRTVQALDLKFEAITTMRDLLTAANMPSDEVANIVRVLSEGK